MKKIGVFADDEMLREKLLQLSNQEFEEWTFFEDIYSVEQAVEKKMISWLILSDRCFDYDQLSAWLEQHCGVPGIAGYIVLLSNRHITSVNELYMKLCLSYGTHIVRPGRSVAAVADEVRTHICNKDQSNVSQTNQMFVFIGTTPNIGTTIASFGTAVKLAIETEHTVGYICLNLKSSKIHRYLGQDEPASTLDALRADLKSQSLTSRRLLQHCVSGEQVPQLHILFGNQVREQAEYFSPEEIDHLLHIAKLSFDICIVEVNAYWDNAATVCGMLKADRRIVVSTQELAHFQEDMHRWIKSVAPMYGIALDSFDLIITQYENNALSRKISVKHIRKESKMTVLGQIQKHSDIQDYLNEGRLMELLLGSHSVNNELAAFSNTLITLCELTRSALPTRRNPGRRRWLSAPGSI